MPKLEVHLLPAFAEPAQLVDRAVVVVDILRASTTIVHALAGGASGVIPYLEVEESLTLARKIGRPAILGGEREGKQIPGFDLGNSPAEYTRQTVGGRTVVFTTTNGTRALLACRSASRVLIGAFVNFSAVCRELAGAPDAAILCAGTNGQVTREDVLFAGALVDDLTQKCKWQLNDQALVAADAWRAAVRALTDRPLGLMLRDSRGGRNLIEIGHESDIDLAAQIDKFDIVPELDLAAWQIRLP